MEFGIQLPIGPAPLDTVFDVAQQAEDHGFDFVFAPDHFNFLPPGEYVYEGWATLAAASTRLDSAGLRTAVSWPHGIHPGVYAQRLATIDHAAAGEVALGFGSGEKMNVGPLGIQWDRPVARMRESIEVMRMLWNGGGSYDGEFYQLQDAQLQLPGVDIPIFLGANSPKTRELTGELGDGWIPHPATPDLYESHVEDVEQGLERRTRDTDRPRMGLQAITAVSDDPEEISRAIYPLKALVATPVTTHLTEAGYDLDVLDDIPESWYWDDLTYDEAGREEWQAVTERIPDEVVDDFNVLGSVAECIDKIEAYQEAGVEEFYLINAGPDPREVLSVYQDEIIPYFDDA